MVEQLAFGVSPLKGQTICHIKVRTLPTASSRLGLKDKEWTETCAVVIYPDFDEEISYFSPGKKRGEKSEYAPCLPGLLHPGRGGK